MTYLELKTLLKKYSEFKIVTRRWTYLKFDREDVMQEIEFKGLKYFFNLKIEIDEACQELIIT